MDPFARRIVRPICLFCPAVAFTVGVVKSSAIKLAALVLLICNPAFGDVNPRASIELAGTLYNPDWEFRENAKGLRLSGMTMLGSKLRIRGTYNSTDTEAAAIDGLIRRIRGLPFGNWHEVGLAYILQVNDRTSAEFEISYQGLELYNEIESGGAILAGISHRFNDRFSAALKLSYFDVQTTDWRLTGDLYTTLTEHIDLVTRIDDTSEFDFTWYEVGLRFRF